MLLRYWEVCGVRTDIESFIKKYKIPTFGFKSYYKNAEKYLSDDEKVLFIYPGNANIVKSDSNFKAKPFDLKNKKPGVFVITSKKVFHLSKVFGDSFQQIPISEVSSYRFDKQPLSGGVIQVFSNNYSIEADISYKNEIVMAARSAMDKALENKNIIKFDNASSTPDIPDQIKKLADLRDQGILTEAEFVKKKTELLEKL